MQQQQQPRGKQQWGGSNSAGRCKELLQPPSSWQLSISSPQAHHIGIGAVLVLGRLRPPPQVHLPEASLAQLLVNYVQRAAAHLHLRGQIGWWAESWVAAEGAGASAHRRQPTASVGRSGHCCCLDLLLTLNRMMGDGTHERCTAAGHVGGAAASCAGLGGGERRRAREAALRPARRLTLSGMAACAASFSFLAACASSGPGASPAMAVPRPGPCRGPPPAAGRLLKRVAVSPRAEGLPRSRVREVSAPCANGHPRDDAAETVRGVGGGWGAAQGLEQPSHECMGSWVRLLAPPGPIMPL